MRYARIYADEDGESHIEDVDVPMESVDFAPPAPPLDLSEFMQATKVAFLGAPPGWAGDWHPAPARQFTLYLRGRVEGEASDGTRRAFAVLQRCLPLAS